MDPYLDNSDANTVLGWLQSTFLAHYNGNRAPFGLYFHVIHLATNYPGVTPLTAQINMINQFLDWMQAYDNVWMVTNQQLLGWMQNPVPVTQLDSVASLKCPVPNVDPTLHICNGITQNELGLLQNCPFTDFPWTTCYGCPTVPPTPSNPVPPQASPQPGSTVRYHLPSNCSTAFWDPVGDKCLCTDATCAFTDQSRAIGPNGEGILPSGGTGGSPSAAPTNFQSFGSSSSLSTSKALLGLSALISVGFMM